MSAAQADQAQVDFDGLMARGGAAGAGGDHRTALDLFRAALALKPRDAKAGMAAAGALAELGRCGEAEAACRAVLADEPGNVEASMWLGHALRRRGDPVGALPLFHAALALRPREAWARMAVADTLAELGRCEEAEAGCRALLADEPENAAALAALGRLLRRRGDPAGALSLFQAAAALRPSETRARTAVAGALFDLGRHDEAEAVCRAVLADEPEDVEASMALGHALRRRGDRAGALPLFRAALALRPREAWARMAVADTLAELGRCEEAEAICRALLADEPENADALMSLGRIAQARGDRPDAADWFGRAARAAPGSAAAGLAFAGALRDRGDLDAAARAARAVLERDPGHAAAWVSLGHTERRAGRPEAALEAFARASALAPGDPEPLVQMAVEERGLGRPEACERLLNRALEADGSDAEALLQLGEHFRMAGRLDEAIGAFRRAMASPRPTPWAFIAAGQTLADSGEMDEALRTLEAAGARLGARPDFACKQAELLRRAGRQDAARELAERAVRDWPQHFGIWFERANLERNGGDPDRLAALLREAPDGGAHERARVHLLRGLLAADRWRFDEAAEHHARAVALDPDDGWPRVCLAQALLLLLDVEGAREQMRAVSRLERSAALLQGRSTNVSQTHLGQLIDEFALDTQALAELRATRDLAPQERVGPLLALVRRCPGYTPAAIGLLTALRRSGRLARRRGPEAPEGASPIPRVVSQYWDAADVPRDLGAVMASWGCLYPRFALRRFSDEDARAFLSRFHGPDVQAAYRRCRQPAQKADIFRLACLWSLGGYYADADDRLVGDFEELRFPGANLVLYQEDFGTVGNNLIGAVPRHPLVGRALRMAVDAVNNGDSDILWLSTGPGLLTRAFTGLLAEPGPRPMAALDDAVVLEHGELGRTVAIHCLVGYKNTERHWSRTAFGRSRTAAASKAAAARRSVGPSARDAAAHGRAGEGAGSPA